jgi:Polyketide cyclase / dehydrase and lipid transport
MPKIAGAIVIDRPVDLVFDFATDERNEPLYNTALLQSEKVSDGPVGVGTRFHALHKSARRPVAMDVQITEYDRPRRMASRTTMSWSEVDGELTFEPDGDATKMRWAWDVHPKGLATLLWPFVGVMGRRSERACWTQLKHYLESHKEVVI